MPMTPKPSDRFRTRKAQLLSHMGAKSGAEVESAERQALLEVLDEVAGEATPEPSTVAQQAAPDDFPPPMTLTLYLVKQEAGPTENQLHCMFCFTGHAVAWETGYRPQGTGKLIGAGVCESCRASPR